MGHPAHPQLRFRVETGRPTVAEDVGLGLRQHVGDRQAVEDSPITVDGDTSEAVDHTEPRISRSADDRIDAHAPLYLPQVPSVRIAESKRDVAVEATIADRTER
jgi:hypothetical protein